jgi:flavin-dependent dehydrogenase
MSHDADVLVVGGGPVGLAAAIEARLRGLTVALVEPRESAIDKACGEGLMPGAVPAFARLGVHPTGRPLRGVAYHDASPRGRGRHVEHRFRSGEGLGVRRTTLSTALGRRADELGVERCSGRVESIRQDAEGVTAAGVRARYLLGADGLHSTVRDLIGVDRGLPVRGRRFGQRRHFHVEPWSDLIEVHWTADVEAYVTPVADDTVGIAILGAQGTRFEEALRTVPALAERVVGAAPASSVRGAGPFRQRTTRRSWGRVMLVGDASGYVDAITGEGIRVGLAQAEAAIDCIVAGRPGYYEREWSQRTREFRTLTAGLVAAATSPLRRGIVPLAVAVPPVFAGAVERLAR